MGNQWCMMSIPLNFPVVLSIFLMACAQVGTIKSMGIYLDDVSRRLGTTPMDIGVALGLFAALSYFPAPLFTALYRRKWMRRIILILGSSLISLGVIMTSLATTNLLMTMYLAIAGFGHCMLTMGSILALDQLSDSSNFNLLFGIGMSGFGLGLVLLPFLADILGRAYDWRGGLLVLGGVMANLVPCSMAIKVDCPVNSNHKKNTPDTDVFEEIGSPENNLVRGRVIRNEDAEMQGESIYIEDKEPIGYGDHLPGLNAKDKLLYESRQPQGSGNVFGCTWFSVQQSDFYMDPVINFIYLVTFMYGVLYCGWHSFLVPHALQRGYSIHDTIFMTFFASVGNFTGRITAGALYNRITNPIILYLGAGLLNAAAILCDVYIIHYYVMATTACLSAVSIAGMSVLGPLILKARASPEYFDVTYAVHEIFFGLGTFLGGYLSGLVGGIYSTYTATFKLLLCVDMVVFSLMIPPLIFKKP